MVRAALWCDQPHSRLFSDIERAERPLAPAGQDSAHATELQVVAAGCENPAHRGALAGSLTSHAAATFDDLRGALTTGVAGGHAFDACIIAHAGDFGSLIEDVAALRTAVCRGTKVFCLSPMPGSMNDLVHTWSDAGQDLLRALRPLGLPSRHPIFAACAELLSAFGDLRSAYINISGGLGAPSLGTCLLHAFDCMFCLVGGDEDSVASIYAGRSPLLPHQQPQQAHAGLHNVSSPALNGDLSVIAALADGRYVTLNISNHAVGPDFHIFAVGPQGKVTITPAGFTWHTPDGTLRANLHLSPGDNVIDKHPDVRKSYARWLARTILQAYDIRTPDPGPLLPIRALLCAHAALLSATTKHPESPATMRRLAEQL